MDLPPDKVKLLRQYDDEKKWDMICDQVIALWFSRWETFGSGLLVSSSCCPVKHENHETSELHVFFFPLQMDTNNRNEFTPKRHRLITCAN